MRNTQLPLLLLLFTAACGASSEAAKEPATPASGSSSGSTDEVAEPSAANENVLSFGWKVPCRVPVERVSEKKGKGAKMRFFVAARPMKDGKIEVRVEDTKFLVIDGEDATTPEVQEKLAPVLPLLSMPVPMIISPEGEYLEARGLDQMIKRMLATPAIANNPKLSTFMEQALRSPQMQAQLASAAGDSWNAWVGAWIGLPNAPGEVVEADDQVPAGAETIPVRLRFEHHGKVQEDDALVRVSITQTLQGEKAAQGLASLIREMAGPHFPKDMPIENIRRITRTEAETDPRTLKPRHVRFEQTVDMTMGGKSQKSREYKDDTFDWSRAEGCR
ncbi:hypothetical protein [Polyangium jinanense]|uniref:Lipoprotein n=1 Tax=Polyangium jinanense TaxID=2829994 RepID=A0A9X3XH98_9BACT|nr:hypothetical protein [Polyangium jinanense]MDC3962733.1 hypothetical protein [Polyangium jinanense]MDC3989335.1 hypothetical protein [Polyangium jinanense]